MKPLVSLPLWPSGLVITTSTTPAACGRKVPFTMPVPSVTPVAGTPAAKSSAPGETFCVVITTGVLSAEPPLLGLTAETIGEGPSTRGST